MATADKLNKLLQTKEAIRLALIEKGQNATVSMPFADYANMILGISATGAQINIADYGAVYNNPTHDNKALIHNAMTELSSKGGGTIIFPDNGDLYVSENIMMQEGIRFEGQGYRPTIKLMPSVKNFWCIIHMDTKKNMSIDNLTIDTNKAGRSQAGNLGDLTTTNSSQMVVSIADKSENISITNSKLIGNGVWVIGVHAGTTLPRNIKINNNEIFWSMGFATPDKPFVNGVTVDNTWVYFDAIDYQFIGNTLDSDTPIANMTAIEAHGAKGVVKNNIVRNARTGIIPWNIVNNSVSMDNDIVIEDNQFIDVLNGVDIGLSPTRNFVGLTIKRNRIHLKPSTFPGARFSRGIILGVWNATNNEISSNFTIEENHITSENYQISITDWESYYNYFGIGIISGNYTNLIIRNNTMDGLPSFGILIQNEVNKKIKINSGNIYNNTLKDTGRSLSNRGPLNLVAFRVVNTANVTTTGLSVGVNEIIDTRSTTDTWYKNPTDFPTGNSYAKQIITEDKMPLPTVVVFDSSTDLFSFSTSRNPSNPYVHTSNVRLTPGKTYTITTTMPKKTTGQNNFFISDVSNSPLKLSLSDGETVNVPLSAEGYTYVSARPLKDPDTGASEPYNYSQINDKTYKFVISEVLSADATGEIEVEIIGGTTPTDPTPNLVNVLKAGTAKIGGATNTYVNNVRTTGDAIPVSSPFELRQWEAAWGGMNVPATDLKPNTAYTLVLEVEFLNTVDTFWLELGENWFGGSFFKGNVPITVTPSGGQYSLKQHVNSIGKTKFYYKFTSGANVPSSHLLGIRADNTPNDTKVMYHRFEIFEGDVNP